MKKLIFILSIVLIGSVYPFSGLRAQHPVPSYDVTLNQTDFTFFEVDEPVINSAEERKINVEVEDGQASQESWADVVIVSKDGTTTLGPYTVSEGTTLVVAIDERDWELRVNDYVEGSELSVWID